MSKQCLDISQMQHLKELGVDTSKASLCLVCLNSEPYLSFYNKDYPQDDEKVIPSFTLQNILDLLPKELIDKYDDKFVLKVEYGILRGVWYIGYYYYDVAFNDTLFSGENIIDAAYGMLCWCVENGYLKTKK